MNNGIKEYFKMKQFFRKYPYGKDKNTKTNKKHTISGNELIELVTKHYSEWPVPFSCDWGTLSIPMPTSLQRVYFIQRKFPQQKSQDYLATNKSFFG